MLRNVFWTQTSLLRLGLGELEQAGGVAARAAGARALEAVEDRADGEVAVDVDAVVVAVGRVAEVLGAGRVVAVRGHVGAARRVVDRVVHAVAVDLRDDEDLQAVDERRGLGVGPVVAHEALRGLEADARGRDLAARAPGSRGTRRPWSRRAILPMRSTYWVCGPRGTVDRGAQQVAQRRGDARLDDAGAGWPCGTWWRGRRLVASGSALIAATTSLAVLVTAPVALVAGNTRIALPVRVTSSAWLAAPCGGTIWAVSVVAAQVAHRPSRSRRPCWAAARGRASSRRPAGCWRRGGRTAWSRSARWWSC